MISTSYKPLDIDASEAVDVCETCFRFGVSKTKLAVFVETTAV
jgi:hypothetical protein